MGIRLTPPFDASCVPAFLWWQGPEGTFKPDPGYSPFSDATILNSTYMYRHADRFIGVRSKEEAAAVKASIDYNIDCQERFMHSYKVSVIEAKIILAIILFAVLGAVWLYRRRAKIGDLTLDASAKALKGWRNTRQKAETKAKAIADEIDRRASS